MAERIPVIMNPAAHSTKAARVVARIEALNPAPEMIFTQYAGHATEIAEKLAREGRELVVAAGGDGTVNEVLQGLCRVNATRSDIATHTALGTLPAGTMNVFAYEIGFPSHRDLANPWRVMTSGARRDIDLWMANDHYFIQLAGMGMDAEIVKATTWQMKKRYGPLAYAIAAVQVLRSQLPTVTIKAPGRADSHGCLALIGNGRNYGGRFPLFREATLTDASWTWSSCARASMPGMGCKCCAVRCSMATNRARISSIFSSMSSRWKHHRRLRCNLTENSAVLRQSDSVLHRSDCEWQLSVRFARRENAVDCPCCRRLWACPRGCVCRYLLHRILAWLTSMMRVPCWTA